MSEENAPRAMRAARAVACSRWAPIIPVPGTAAKCEDTNATIAHDVAAANGASVRQKNSSSDPGS